MRNIHHAGLAPRIKVRKFFHLALGVNSENEDVLPHPGPLPKGEGESYSAREVVQRRAIRRVC